MKFPVRFTQIFFLIVILFHINIFSQESTLEFARSLPNPRKQNSSWILDQSKILESAGAKDRINQILEQLEKDTTIEVALVILPTIGNLVPKNLATEIFQVWGVGKLGKDNGVLILHVLDQRRIEIETGYGMEGILSDVICKRLLEERTIPYFKLSAFSTGHENLVRTIDRILRSKNETPTSILTTYISTLPEPEKAVADSIPEEILPLLDSEFKAKKSWRANSIYFFLSGIFLLFLYRFLLYKTTSHWKTKYESPKNRDEFFGNLSVFCYGLTSILLTAGSASLLYSFFGKEHLVFFIFVPGVTTIVLTSYFSIKMYRKWEEFLKTAPIHCRKCKSKSFAIEDENDQYRLLGEEERFELRRQIFKFSIYECSKCKNLEIKKTYGPKFGTYSKCPKCNFIAVTHKHKTLKEPTYNEQGEEEIKKTCSKCGHNTAEKSILPRKSKSSYSNSSTNTNYSSPSSNNSNSSYSSSSSSDDNFGGGSSGGGGAGTSY